MIKINPCEKVKIIARVFRRAERVGSLPTERKNNPRKGTFGLMEHPTGYLKAYPNSVLTYSGQSAVAAGVASKGVAVGGAIVSVGDK